MKDEDILVGAPSGATHSENHLYLKFDNYWYTWEDEWFPCGCNIQCYDNIRSLADIQAIVDLRKANAELKACGTKLSNLAFNLKQDGKISPDVRAYIAACQRKWDAVCGSLGHD